MHGNLILPGIAAIAQCLLFVTLAPLSRLAAQPEPEKLLALINSKPIKPAADADELGKLIVARYNAAVNEMRQRIEEFRAGRGTYELIGDAARRLSEAELELSDKPADQFKAREKYFEFAKEMEDRSQQSFKAGRVTRANLLQARFNRLDAEIQLLKAKRKLKSDK